MESKGRAGSAGLLSHRLTCLELQQGSVDLKKRGELVSFSRCCCHLGTVLGFLSATEGKTLLKTNRLPFPDLILAVGGSKQTKGTGVLLNSFVGLRRARAIRQ